MQRIHITVHQFSVVAFFIASTRFRNPFFFVYKNKLFSSRPYLEQVVCYYSYPTSLKIAQQLGAPPRLSCCVKCQRCADTRKYKCPSLRSSNYRVINGSYQTGSRKFAVHVNLVPGTRIFGMKFSIWNSKFDLGSDTRFGT